MRHALEQMRRVGEFGDMFDDHVEKSHQDMDVFYQRVARLKSLEARFFASLISRRQLSIRGSLLLIERGNRKKTMHKQKATVSSMATITSSEKKVVTRETKRSGNLTAEQMRPSREKIQPHEILMLDFQV